MLFRSQNRYLVQNCVDGLTAVGFRVALNVDLPPNDGCISYGQAVVQYNKEVNLGTSKVPR